MKSDRLITIRRYLNPIEATIAMNALRSAGIQAYLNDASAVQGLQFTNASGGLIQLLVAESDRELAIEEIETRQTESSAPRPLESSRHPSVSIDNTDYQDPTEIGEDELRTEDIEARLSERERDAERALRGALLFFVFPPLQLLVSWLLIKVLCSDEPLSPKSRQQAWLAASLNVPYLFFMLWALRIAAR